MINYRNYFLIILIAIALSINAGKNDSKHSIETQKRPLKILCVCTQFPVLSNVFILNQITGLLKRKHHVTIYAYGAGDNIVHPDVLKYNLLDLLYYKELPHDIASYDIILCQYGHLGVRFLKIKKQLNLKAKLITCFRGYDLTKLIKQHGTHMYDELFAKGDLFLPVCHYFKNVLLNLGCNPRKIVVLHSGIDLTRFAFSPQKPINNDIITIVSVNRLVPKKGMTYSIDAVSSLLKKYPNIRYKIMGEGPLKEELLQQIRSLNTQHAITLLGRGTTDEVASLLKNADIFILPSLTDKDGNQEGIPNALKEAMAAGVPVISTRHAGIEELIEHNKTGLLVPSETSTQLAEAIDYCIQHATHREQMRLAARKYVTQEYDTEIVNNKLTAIFDAALQRPLDVPSTFKS